MSDAPTGVWLDESADVLARADDYLHPHVCSTEGTQRLVRALAAALRGERGRHAESLEDALRTRDVARNACRAWMDRAERFERERDEARERWQRLVNGIADTLTGGLVVGNDDEAITHALESVDEARAERDALRERVRARPGSEAPPIDHAESDEDWTRSVRVWVELEDGWTGVGWRNNSARQTAPRWGASGFVGRVPVVRWWPLPGDGE